MQGNGRWFTPIGLHVIPKLGNYPVEEITQRDLERVIKPLWNTKHETARKALNRLNVIIKYAAALGLNVDIGVVDKAKTAAGTNTASAKEDASPQCNRYFQILPVID